MDDAIQAVFEQNSALVLPLCLTLYNHTDPQGKKIVDHQIPHDLVEIVHNIINTVTQGSFQIKLDQTDSFMHLKDPQPQVQAPKAQYGFSEYTLFPDQMKPEVAK